MEAMKLASPRLRTSVPVPTWPMGVTVPSGEDITSPYRPADKVRRLLDLSWDDMARLHDTGKLPLERRHGHLVVHEDDALGFCSPDELSGEAEELWDEAQAKGSESNTNPVPVSGNRLSARSSPGFSQAVDDARLLERYRDGIVPPWDCELCKQMLSEWYGPDDGEPYLCLQRVRVSSVGWTAFDGAFMGGDFALYKWVTKRDADDELEHYQEIAREWHDDLTRRVKDAFARKSADAKDEGGVDNE